MKRYPLTQSKEAVVDDDVYEKLVQLRRCWQATKRRHTWYAVTDIDGHRVYMHRWILDAPARRHVDHINGDGLDNQRENLRVTTPTQNALNRHKPTASASGFRGVRLTSDESSWCAYANIGNEQKHLGCFETAEAAAVVRDDYMRRNHPTARLNFATRADAPMTLREARRQLLKRPKSKTGYPNIRENRGRFEAWTRADGQRVWLGRFDTVEEALAAQAEHK